MAETHIASGNWLVRIKLDEVAHEKIEKSVSVVIEECAACTPAALLLRKAGLPGNIGKSSVPVVMKQYVMPPECAKQIVPSIVVVIANANAGLPAGAPESRLICYIGKCAVTVVLVQMSGWLSSRCPMRIKPASITQVDVQPAIVVVIKKRQPASFGFDDDALGIYPAPYVGSSQSGLLCDVDKLNLRRGRARYRGFHNNGTLPLPKWSCESIGQCGAEQEKR